MTTPDPLLGLLLHRLAPAVWGAPSTARTPEIAVAADALGWDVTVARVDPTDKAALIEGIVAGWELWPSTARNWDALVDALRAFPRSGGGPALRIVEFAATLSPGDDPALPRDTALADGTVLPHGRALADITVLADVIADAVRSWTRHGATDQVLWLGPPVPGVLPLDRL